MLSQAGEIWLPRNMPTRPEMVLKALAPSREERVVAVACLLPWYWLADRCARAALPCVVGHALSRNAMHGGKATTDTIDAQKSAVLLRGGMLPQAYVYAAEMRATRDLRRRRLPLTRKRAEVLAHLQHTHRPYNRPESGTTRAYHANRPGVAERLPAPAVPQSLAVDLALLGYDAQRLHDGA